MKFFYKLENKYRKYAIHNLMYYIIAMYVAGMAVMQFMPEVYDRYLSLDAAAILHGQVWRIVTFMIYPPGGGGPLLAGMFFNLVALYLYYMLGTTLERVWGAFRFNVYFFMGVIGHVLAAVIIYLALGYRYPLDTTFLNESLFLAFAFTFPEMQFLLFFVLPIKAKVLGIFIALGFAAQFAIGTAAERISIGLSLLNFVIFFLMTRDTTRINPREIKRKSDFKKGMKIRPQGGTTHRCAVCGRTEKDSPNLEFRYCSKCEGSYEYCMDHLYTHRHVTREEAEAAKKTNN